MSTFSVQVVTINVHAYVIGEVAIIMLHVDKPYDRAKTFNLPVFPLDHLQTRFCLLL